MRLRQIGCRTPQDLDLLLQETVALAQLPHLLALRAGHSGLLATFDAGFAKPLVQSADVHAEVFRDLRERDIRFTGLRHTNDIVAELLGKRLGHDDILPGQPLWASQLRCHLSVQQSLEFRAETLLAQQRRRLEKVESLRGLELWRDEMVERNALRDGAYGCPLGSIANEIADHHEDTRRIIATHFDEWLQMLIDAIDRLRTIGILRADADSRALASGLLAALQGGYLLAKTARDVNLMRVALDMAIAQVRAFSVESNSQN